MRPQYRLVECVREDDDVAMKKLHGGPVPGMTPTARATRLLWMTNLGSPGHHVGGWSLRRKKSVI